MKVVVVVVYFSTILCVYVAVFGLRSRRISSVGVLEKMLKRTVNKLPICGIFMCGKKRKRKSERTNKLEATGNSMNS